jgi:hypothetical protein
MGMRAMLWRLRSRLAPGLAAGVVAVLAAGCIPWGMLAEDEAWVAGEIASSLEVGIATGEVRLVLHVSNTTERVLEFTFPTSQRYDFVVENLTGQEVWRWSADRSFLQVVTDARLEPGETWTMEAVWSTEREAGTYVATGRLTAMDRQVEQRAEFELP